MKADQLSYYILFLSKDNMKKIIITSALPYVNNVPHLGNLIGCVLSADVFARYCRGRGYNTLYVCGTDEYGTVTVAKAIEEKCTTQEICNKYYKIHKEIYQWFGISTDIFGRTSTKKHAELVQQIFLDLYKNKMIVEKEIEQPYDEKLMMFLADRFVIGKCPHCGSESARADQCDKCGKLLSYSELIDAKSKLSGSKPVLRKSMHLLLDLPKVQGKLEKWIDGVEEKEGWSENTIAIAKSWLKEGLIARSITRDLKWGVPVPLEGWEKKVFYVWFDAPIGYISITANLTEEYMDWWGGSEDVKHYEFIGKDNVPFHAIIFPATLIGTGKKWTLPYHISSTEFLNYEDGKFSKSKGVGVFGNDAMNTGIPADVWRYYLLSNRPESSDTTFSWEDFGKRANNELLANFGNLVNRVLVFLEKNFEGKVPKGKLKIEDREFCDAQRIRIAKVEELLEEVKIRGAVSEFMAIASAANTYFQLNEPWKLMKEDKETAGTVLNVLVNQVCDLAILCEPFLPFTSKKIFEQLNVEPKGWEELGRETVLAGHKIGKVSHLFSPIEEGKLEELRKKYSGKQNAGGGREESNVKGGKGSGRGQDSVNKQDGKKDNAGKRNGFERNNAESGDEKEKIGLDELELEVGLIESVEKHPNADKLYVEKVLMKGGEMRQIVSGLAQYYKPEELISKTCVMVKNLKSAKLRGVKSDGMLLAVHNGDELEVISPVAVAGAEVEIEGVERKGKYREISIDEFFSIKMEAKDGIAYVEGKKLKVNDMEVKLKKIKNGKIS
ncbi:MAG: methionine--tRNA ligase [Candidatus Micrarchaeota archaeon]